jgi:REP element-mobilizing transposase RayT
MAQSLAQVYLHLVFSTKQRYPWLKDRSLRQDLYAYIAVTLNNMKCPCLITGGVEDHVHILCKLSREVSIADLVRDIKKASTGMLTSRSELLRGFHWQSGYAAFSISPAHVAGLTEYIRNQEEHHGIESYPDEVRRLLRKYGLEYDERYVWD